MHLRVCVYVCVLILPDLPHLHYTHASHHTHIPMLAVHYLPLTYRFAGTYKFWPLQDTKLLILPVSLLVFSRAQLHALTILIHSYLNWFTCWFMRKPGVLGCCALCALMEETRETFCLAHSCDFAQIFSLYLSTAVLAGEGLKPSRKREVSRQATCTHVTCANDTCVNHDHIAARLFERASARELRQAKRCEGKKHLVRS